MRLSIRAALLATTLAVGGLVATAPAMPAAAQYFRADYDHFHDALARDGDWVYSDRWGVVWIPDNVPNDFKPYYSRGHWVDTEDYGWVWSSGYRWGDITFHYGRWVNDPDDGWMWIPGYVWSPGWVVWRTNRDYTGWMPMPPDDAFLRGDEGASFSVGFRFGDDRDFAGYGRWYGRDYNEDRYAANWTFVGTRYLGASDYRSRAARGPQVANIIRNSSNVTNYTVVNDRVVNRSISVQAVVQAGGKPIRPVRIETVIKQPGIVASVSQGRAIQMEARRDRPHGNGQLNSAPTPSQSVILQLSPRGPRMGAGGGGRPPVHIFTRETIGNAPFRPGMPGAAPPPNGGPNGSTGRDWRNRGGETGPNGAPPPGATPNTPNGGPAGGPPNGGGDRNNHGGPNGATPQAPTPPKPVPPAAEPAPAPKPPVTVPTTAAPPGNAMAPNNGPGNGGGRGGFRDRGGSGATQGGPASVPGTVPGTPAPSSGATGEPRMHHERGGMNGPGGAANPTPPPAPAAAPTPPPRPVTPPPAPVTPPPHPAATPPAPPPPPADDNHPHKEHPDKSKDKDKDNTAPQ